MTTPVSFDWKDPLNANSLLTEEEQAISETAESYCQERMLPRVLGTFISSHILYLLT
jgi:glutaryl-CoA dehydrogenase